MEHLNSSRPVVVVAFAVLAAAFSAGRTCQAIDVWMPQTGEVSLDEVPRESPEGRFRHAAALIGGGDPMSGVGQLRELIEEDPYAEWIREARHLVALGLLAAGRYKEAYDEWEDFLSRYPESEGQYGVREMQLKAATALTRENLEEGLALCERLVADAPTKEFAARCQREKADAIMDAKRFLLARDEYAAVLDYDPETQWEPYCWYKVAECDLEMALWLRRGTEGLERARTAFTHFTEEFPEHHLADRARERLAEVRARQAAGYKVIAEYYLGPGNRPAAALPYLHYITTECPDTKEAKWAAQKITELIADPNVEVKDSYRDIERTDSGPTQAEDRDTGPASTEQ